MRYQFPQKKELKFRQATRTAPGISSPSNSIIKFFKFWLKPQHNARKTVPHQHSYSLNQWCTTSGPRATSGPRRVLMWPRRPTRKTTISEPSTVDHKSNTLNQLTIIFNSSTETKFNV